MKKVKLPKYSPTIIEGWIPEGGKLVTLDSEGNVVREFNPPIHAITDAFMLIVHIFKSNEESTN